MGNIILKITAVVCAIALWFYVISLKNFQLTMNVPLSLVKLQETLAIASKPPSTIKITMEGHPLDLIRLQSQQQSVAMVVDLQNAELGTKRYHLNAKNFVAQNYPGVHYVEPDNQYLFVDVTVDTRIERNIPIKSNVSFIAAPGYLLTQEPQFLQDNLKVSGARNALTRIIDIPTDSMYFDTLKASQTFSIPLDFDNFPAFVSPSDSIAKIFVDVQKISTKEFKHVPVQLIGYYDRAHNSIIPSDVSVEITGGAKVLESISNDDIALLVEYNRFAIEDTDSLPPTVKLTLPSDVNREMSIKAIQIKPDRVKLKKSIVYQEPTTSEEEF